MSQTVLLFGGSSGERLVSVASAQNLAENFNFSEILFLDKVGVLYAVTKTQLLGHQNPFLNEFKPMVAALAQSLEDAVPTFKGKVIFMAFHGTEGEDGKIQSLFEKNKVAYTGSGATASANAFNKEASKRIVKAAGIKTTDEMIFSPKNTDQEKSKISNFFKAHKKIVLKPLANGSSLGLFIVADQSGLDQALSEISKNNLGDYLIEKFVVGRELTVGVYDGPKGLQVLPPSEVILNAGSSFDYEGKYLGRGSKEITPAAITPAQAQVAQQMALDAHQALQCFGYTRTDLILTNDGPVYLETNTLPGLSRPSFIPQQLQAADIKFSDFIQRQIDLASTRKS